jgi:anti-sigma regulatory factor (Ser/Thr protein kinase)
MHTEQHASTVGVVERTFPCAPEQVRRARRWAAWVYEEAGADPDDIYLLVSELATNAVVHAGTAFVVRIHSDELWVEVCDWSDAMPRFEDPTAESESGRGLELLAVMAEEVAVEALPTGKLVCFRPKIAYRGSRV